MNIFKYTFIMIILAGTLSSCYEEDYWLEDHTTTEGKNYPVIQSIEIEGTPNPGSTINLVMHYWSEDPIQEHQLYDSISGYGSEELYSTTPYSYNYDSDAGSEVVTLSYEVPSSSVLPTDTVEIELRVMVVNENGLTRESSTSIEVVK